MEDYVKCPKHFEIFYKDEENVSWPRLELTLKNPTVQRKILDGIEKNRKEVKRI